MITLYKKTYHGFESLSDYWRDMDEAISSDFNEKMKEVPGEFKGSITVTITYEPHPNDRGVEK